jgi:NADPH:quinone reductase-like Zn-dependent oxidoreductase
MIGLGVQAANGPVEILTLPDPREPQSGELLLEVIAAGIGPWDPLLHTGGWDVGLVPPAALGVEAAGRVLATGPDVRDFSPGDVVLTHDTPLPTGSGMWAQRVIVHASSAAACPPDLSPQVAAGLPVAALTAQQALDDLKVGQGTRLLVVGASAPTAALAVQLAHLSGAEVTAGAGPAHAARLRELGACEVIDTHLDAWSQTTSQRFDAVLIAAQGTSLEAMSLLVDGGRLSSLTGDAPQAERGIDSTDLYVSPDGAALGRLAALVATGTLSFNVQVVAIEEGAATADLVGRGRSGGTKYVLTL